MPHLTVPTFKEAPEVTAQIRRAYDSLTIELKHLEAEKASATQEHNELTRQLDELSNQGAMLEEELKTLAQLERQLLQGLPRSIPPIDEESIEKEEMDVEMPRGELQGLRHSIPPNDEESIEKEEMDVEMPRGDNQPSLPPDPAISSQLAFTPEAPSAPDDSFPDMQLLDLPPTASQTDHDPPNPLRTGSPSETEDMEPGPLDALPYIVSKAFNGHVPPYPLNSREKMVIALTYGEIIEYKEKFGLDTAEDCAKEISRLQLVDRLPLHLAFAIDSICHRVSPGEKGGYCIRERGTGRGGRIYDGFIAIVSVLEAGATFLGSLKPQGKSLDDKDASDLGKDLREVASLFRDMKTAFRSTGSKLAKKPAERKQPSKRGGSGIGEDDDDYAEKNNEKRGRKGRMTGKQSAKTTLRNNGENGHDDGEVKGRKRRQSPTVTTRARRAKGDQSRSPGLEDGEDSEESEESEDMGGGEDGGDGGWNDSDGEDDDSRVDIGAEVGVN